jgi:hypothetical protein
MLDEIQVDSLTGVTVGDVLVPFVPPAVTRQITIAV